MSNWNAGYFFFRKVLDFTFLSLEVKNAPTHNWSYDTRQYEQVKIGYQYVPPSKSWVTNNYGIKRLLKCFIVKMWAQRKVKTKVILKERYFVWTFCLWLIILMFYIVILKRIFYFSDIFRWYRKKPVVWDGLRRNNWIQCRLIKLFSWSEQ